MKTETSGVAVYLDGDVMKCAIGGEIDHHTARSIRMKIDEEIYRHRPNRVILDLSRVDFMDSSGLGLILGRYAKASEVGAECILLDPNEHVTRILDVAGIGRLIRIERRQKKQ